MRTLLITAVLAVAVAAPAQVVINELLYDTDGSDTHCFIELYGTSGTDLSGWSLVAVNGHDGTTIATIPLSGTIPGDGFFVIAQDNGVANYDIIDVNANLQNGPDNLELHDNTETILDAVGYGSFGWEPDTFFVGEGDPAPDAWADVSLIRTPDGSDTNNNYDDFHVTETPTPGTANTGALTPTARDIYTIQYTTDPGGVSPDTGLFVSVTGVVSAAALPDNMNAAMADAPGAWHGIILYTGPDWVLGDSVTVLGQVSEYNGKTEVSVAHAIRHGAGTVPTAATVQVDQINTGSATAESYEATLCEVLNVTVNDTDLGFGEWQVTDGFEDLAIDNSNGLYSYTPALNDELDITGILNYSYSAFKLAPRFDADIVAVSVDDELAGALPGEYALAQNHPNPFNPSTTIGFYLPEAGHVSLAVYNVLGQEVATLLDGELSAGRHQIRWDGDGLSSGVYFCRLVSGDVSLARSMVLMK